MEEKVDTEFSFVEFSEENVMQARKYFHRWAGMVEGDVFDLSEALLEQVNVGSLICVPDDKDEVAVGLSVIINPKQHPKALNPVVAKLHSLLQTSMAGQGILDRVAKSNCGFLLLERIASGLPIALCRKAHKSLIEDLSWSLAAPDCSEDEKAFYRLEYIVGFTWGYSSVDGGSKKGGPTVFEDMAPFLDKSDMVVFVDSGEEEWSESRTHKLRRSMVVFCIGFDDYKELASIVE